MRRKATLWVAGGLTAVALMAGGVSAGAKQRVDSFAGSCSVQGTVTFDPPATNVEQALAVAYDATGRCTGKLDGRSVTNAPVTLHHAGQSLGSCQQAHTTGPGQGAIVFGDRTVIPYGFEFRAIATEILFDLYGQRSGHASGHGTFLTTRTPPDVAAKCAGSGVVEIPMDLTLRTDSPLVSGPAGHVGRSGS
jgi:hypothetical protein